MTMALPGMVAARVDADQPTNEFRMTYQSHIVLEHDADLDLLVARVLVGVRVLDRDRRNVLHGRVRQHL